MNRCKTCKWWSKKNPHWGMMQGNVSLHLRRCLWERCDDTWRTQDAVATLDSEGIFTGPNFGCIHHEETQEQLPQEHPGYADQLIKRELGPGALRPAQGVPFTETPRPGQVTHLYNPHTGENEPIQQ